MIEYRDFLKQKARIAQPVGLDLSTVSLSSSLFPYQRAIVERALQVGRFAIFADTGLGKALMALEWGQSIGGTILLLTPLSVSHQFIREAKKFGIPNCRLVVDQSQLQEGINICNYEKLHKFSPDGLSAIILDECFPCDTLIDCIDGNQLVQRRIDEVQVGDKILNASGIDVVSDVHRRKVEYAIKVTINGKAIISSPNHPYFTQCGWVAAQDLTPNHKIMATTEAMRMVWEGIYQKNSSTTKGVSVLQSILLSEMAHESTGAFSQGSYTGSEGKTGQSQIGMVQEWMSKSRIGTRKDSQSQSNEQSRIKTKMLPEIETDEPQTFRAWGQWEGFDGSATDYEGCTWRRLDSGICFVTGKTETRISNSLQNRLSESRSKNSYRSGWCVTSQQKGQRQEEGCNAQFSWVDSLEVLEQGHPELERYRDEDGSLYFYDIGGTQHPSFSIYGNLVHNSSCLKGYDSHYRKELTKFAKDIPYRLCCTATPAPNDLIEISNHAEFLGVNTEKEVKALFFTQDGNTTHNWRLKGHAHKPFYQWLSSWAVAVRKPSDMGNFDDSSHILPPLNYHHHTVAVKQENLSTLFAMEAQTLSEQRQAKRDSLEDRIAKCAELVNNSDETWIVWCELNIESEALVKAIDDAEQVTGSQSDEVKEFILDRFQRGELRVLVSKVAICGFGLNWQHCHNVAFVGLSHSFEQQYQAIRRCWRFGQTNPVDVHFIASELEGAIVKNVKRKEAQYNEMMEKLTAEMKDFQVSEPKEIFDVKTGIAKGDNWIMYLGDCIERIDEIPDNSIDLSCYSPPFPGMYVYTDTPADIGNSADIYELVGHFKFLAEKLIHKMKSGRNVCVHLTQEAVFKGKDGHVGLRDFRGEVIRMMESVGFIYYSEVTIDRNPQVKAIRTKDHSLMFTQLAKDSAFNRVAMADYLIVFKKPGENKEPICSGLNNGKNLDGWITNDEWIRWARPVWYSHDFAPDGDGIRETDVLNVRSARESDDERHLCPLQLGVIERAVKLWSNPGDIVFSPFGGIGSEGYKAIELNRKYIGIELKESYWQTACKNLRQAEHSKSTQLALTF